jgi:membrane fusion protein (multidrug efflux system)
LADGSKYPYEGTVETVEGTIDRVTGSISFRAIFPNKDFILKHGGSGRVSIPRSLENAFLIAQKSTFEIQDKVFVFTVDQAGVVHQKAVEIDKRLPKLYSLKSGLAPSERVLFEGVQLIKAGDTIPVQQGKLFDLIQR